ncbi:galactan 1,3-beta-galactosidase [Mycena galericulata]|nr:galactan 1,3-beta-galactosidase [Mycena galericulata]
MNFVFAMRILSLLAIPALSLLARATVIVPGATWTDTSGTVIQGHGAGFLKVGSTFYWFGEDKAAISALFSASTDMMTWTRQNNALTPIAGTMISSANIVERPKVLFNKAPRSKPGNNFHIYICSSFTPVFSYGAAQVGVATSNIPLWAGSFSPLGAQSRDESVFQDDDETQTAYLLYASDNNQNFKISRMDANYLNVTEEVNVLTASTLEAPGMLKRDDQYFLFASHTSGWAPNPNKWFVSSNISAPFSAQSDLAPEAVSTYFSQNAFDMPLGTNAIYMGDRWRPDLLGSSRYIWLPMSWATGVPQLVWADVWTFDIAAGTYTVAAGTSYEAEHGVLSGGATIASNSAFSGGEAVGFLGNGGSVTITVQGIGAAQWVSLYYANGDATWRNTTVSVNGGPTVLVDQPNTGGGHVILSVPVKLSLNSGSNTITFGADQTNYAGDLDRIIVYTAS